MKSFTMHCSTLLFALGISGAAMSQQQPQPVSFEKALDQTYKTLVPLTRKPDDQQIRTAVKQVTPLLQQSTASMTAETVKQFNADISATEKEMKQARAQFPAGQS